jgi:hypothetical protein
MSHTTICFMTGAEDLRDAEDRVNTYLETENFFDYSEVRHENSGPLEQKHQFLSEFINGWDWKEAANGFLREAEGAKSSGDFGLYGYYLIIAGELYSQNLNTGAYVFNIESGDYSIPDNPRGWWLIAVDFHY